MALFSISLRISAVIAGIAAAVLFFLVGNSKERLQDQLQSAFAASDSLAAELQAAESENDRLERSVEQLDSDLGAEKARATSLYQQTVETRRELSEVRDELRSVREDLARREADLRQVRRELVSSRTAVPAASGDELAALQRDLEQMRERNRQLESDLEAALRRQAGPAMSPAGAATPATATARTDPVGPPAGLALSVGITAVSPDFSFVGLNIGTGNGIVPQTDVALMRGTTSLARLTISSATRDESVGRVQPYWGDPSRLRAGENVTLVVQ